MVHSKPVQMIDAPELAKVFIDLVVQHHGPSNSIVGNWNSVCTSTFWSPRYHFQVRLQLHAFKLIARVSYEENIIFRSRSN